MKNGMRLIGIVMALVLLVGLFAGCTDTSGSGDNSGANSGNNDNAGSNAGSSNDNANGNASSNNSGEKKTLKVWGGQLVSQSVNDALEARIMAFEQAENCIVDFEWLEEVNYHIKLSAALESGDLADVVYCAEQHAFKYYPDVPFMDLKEVKATIEAQIGRQYMPGMLREIEGQLYNLPFIGYGAGGFFRKSVWATIGIDESNFPTTWDEVADACLRLQATNPPMYSCGIGCGSTDNDSEVNLREWMWTLGGGLFDANGDPDTVKAANIHVWTRYKELWDAGCVPPDSLSWSGVGNNNSYLTGECALMYNNVSFYGAVKGDEDLLADTGFVVHPEGYLYGSPGGYGIMKTTKEPELAAKLLAFLVDPDWYDDFMLDIVPLGAPVFAEVIENNPSVFTGVSAACDFRGIDTVCWGFPANSTAKGLANGSVVFGAYAHNLNLQRMLLDKIPVQKALEDLQAEMEGLVRN